MAEVPKVIKQWQMVQPTVFNRETKEKTPGKLAMAEIPVPELKEGEVLGESRRLWSMPYRPWLFL